MTRVITLVKAPATNSRGHRASRTRLEVTTKTPSLTFASRNVQQRDDYAPQSRKPATLTNNSLFFHSVFHAALPPGAFWGNKKKKKKVWTVAQDEVPLQ